MSQFAFSEDFLATKNSLEHPFSGAAEMQAPGKKLKMEKTRRGNVCVRACAGGGWTVVGEGCGGGGGGWGD